MVSRKGISQEMIYLIIALIVIILFLGLAFIYITGKAEIVIENLKNLIKVVIRK